MSQGLSAQDLRARAQAQTLRRNGGVLVEPDPIDSAMQLGRKLAAQKIIERAVTETGVAAIEAENARLKAEIEGARLRAEVQTGTAGARSNEWQEYIIAQVDKLQGQLADTQKALSEQQMGALHERLEMLAGELDRIRNQSSDPVNPTAVVKQSIVDAKELLEMISPPAPDSKVEVADPKLQAWSLKAQLDYKRWELDRADKRELELTRLEMDKQIRQAELDMKLEQSRRMDRFLSDTAPKILEVGQRLLDQFISQARTAPAPLEAMPSLRASPSIAIPPGAVSATCEQCGNTVLYRPDWGGVICQRCGAVYANDQTRETSSSTPQDDKPWLSKPTRSDDDEE